MLEHFFFKLVAYIRLRARVSSAVIFNLISIELSDIQSNAKGNHLSHIQFSSITSELNGNERKGH